MVRHKRLRPSAARYVDSTGTEKSFAIKLKILQYLVQDFWELKHVAHWLAHDGSFDDSGG